MALSDTVSVELEPAGRGEAQAQPFLHLLLVADRPLAPGRRWSLQGAPRVALGREEVPADGEPGLALALADPGVSARHAELRRTGDDWTVADLGSKNGTLVNGQRVRATPLADGDLIELGNTFLLFRESCAGPGTPADLDGRAIRERPPGLATWSTALAQELEKLRAVAQSRIPVFLAGETGTGKEVLATAVHRMSGRPGPLVAVNCGAVARNLIESELFGYRKGAFSGADEDRPGLVRSADRGTLFLDEIAELPPPAQASLLRVLQEAEVLPVGGTRPVKVDLRLVVATHRDLEAMAAAGGFREDLLARLAGFRLELPPLNERREDLGLLIASLLERHAAPGWAAGFSPDAARALLLHAWPLNVRELDRCLATAVVLAGAGRIELAHLPAAVRGALDGPRTRPSPPAELDAAERQQREELIALLREHRGNVTAVAAALGKFRTQVQRWMKRYQLDPQQYRG